MIFLRQHWLLLECELQVAPRKVKYMDSNMGSHVGINSLTSEQNPYLVILVNLSPDRLNKLNII